MLAVLCLCLRVWHYLSVLVYAGLSLFIISGPYLYMVVCVLYAYNLTRGDPLENRKVTRLNISSGLLFSFKAGHYFVGHCSKRIYFLI